MDIIGKLYGVSNSFPQPVGNGVIKLDKEASKKFFRICNKIDAMLSTLEFTDYSQLQPEIRERAEFDLDSLLRSAQSFLNKTLRILGYDRDYISTRNESDNLVDVLSQYFKARTFLVNGFLELCKEANCVPQEKKENKDSDKKDSDKYEELLFRTRQNHRRISHKAIDEQSPSFDNVVRLLEDSDEQLQN